MDWDKCNHKKINQFQKEAQRWNTDKATPNSKTAQQKKRKQPTKRAKQRK
jgi:hypothetical protein